VQLTELEKRMQAGEYGPGTQRAMDLLVKYDDSFDAESFAPFPTDISVMTSALRSSGTS